MRRLLILIAATLAVTVLAVPSAWAGLGTSPTAPHFIDISATVSQGTLYVSIKEAGLGTASGSTFTTEASTIAWSVTAVAHCTNAGGNNPSAANKNVSAEGVFPVEGNGQVTGIIGLTPTFQPPCVPPMTLSFIDLTVTDTTNNITQTVPGTFSRGRARNRRTAAEHQPRRGRPEQVRASPSRVNPYGRHAADAFPGPGGPRSMSQR